MKEKTFTVCQTISVDAEIEVKKDDIDLSIFTNDELLEQLSDNYFDWAELQTVHSVFSTPKEKIQMIRAILGLREYKDLAAITEEIKEIYNLL